MELDVVLPSWFSDPDVEISAPELDVVVCPPGPFVVALALATVPLCPVGAEVLPP